MKRHTRVAASAALLWAAMGGTAAAEDGVTATEVVLGMSTALEGPAADLGRGVRRGVEAALRQANEAGGVHGRRLRLVALDDGYEPSRCAPNMRKLLTEEKVFAVIGNVGTPTAVVSVPIANEARALLFGSFTGAGVLRRTPPDRYVINYRASYAEETGAMVDALVKDLGILPARVAFFTQNDAYGDAGYFGGIEALKRHGLADPRAVPHGRYPRNTSEVEQGLAVLLEAPTEVEAIIMVGAYAPCARFIRLASEDFPAAIFLNVSFVGAQALARDLARETPAMNGNTVKVVCTQVVPHPDGATAAAREYRDLLRRWGEQEPAGFVDLEGFLSARLFIEGLRRAGRELTREGHVDALEALRDVDLGTGERLSLSPTEHQASHRVWPTVLRDGRWVELTEWRSLR